MKALRNLLVLAAVALSVLASPMAAGAQGAGGAAHDPLVTANCGTPPYTYVAGQYAPPTQNTGGSGCTSASFSGTVTATGFTPNGSYTNSPMSVTGTTSEVALPTGTAIAVENVGSNVAYVNLGTSGSVTATTAQQAIPVGGGCVLTVGSNTNIAAITGSSTSTLNLVGGAGLGQYCWGGGSSGGSGSNASVGTTGAAVPGSGTYVGMNVSGNLTGLTGTANGLKVDGSGVTQPISASTLPLPTGASTSALQTTGNSSLATVVTQTAGVAQGSTSSGQTLSPIGCRTISSSPTDTTAQTNMPTCDTSGRLIINVGAGSTGNAAASATGSAVPASGSYNAINVGGTLRGQTGSNPTGTTYSAHTDLTSVAGTTAATGTGAQSAGTPRVTVAQDTATIAGSAVGTAGSPSTNVVSMQGVSSGTAVPVSCTACGTGATGSAVPANANYVAGVNGGNLTGMAVDSSGHQIVVGAGTAGSASGGVATVQGAASMTPLLVTPSAPADPCFASTKLFADFESTTSGGSIITAVSAKKAYICSISIVTSAAANVSVIEGTGSSVCTGGTTAGDFLNTGVTAANGAAFAANGGINAGTGTGTIFANATANQNVCLLFTTTNSPQVNAHVSYVSQ